MKKKISNYLNKIKDSKAQRRGIAFAMALTVLFGNGLFYLPGAVVTAEETPVAADSPVADPGAGNEEQGGGADIEPENPEQQSGETESEGEEGVEPEVPGQPEGEPGDEPTDDVTVDENQQPDEAADSEGAVTEDPYGIAPLADGDTQGDLTYYSWNVSVDWQRYDWGAYKDITDVWGYAGEPIKIRATITVEGNGDPNAVAGANGFAFDGPTSAADAVLGGLGNTYDGSAAWVQDASNPSKWQLEIPVELLGQGNRSIHLYLNGKIEKTFNVNVKERSTPDKETMYVKSSYITWAEDKYLDKDKATNMMDGKFVQGSPNGNWQEVNSEETPLTIYIGGTLEVKAQDGTNGMELVYGDVQYEGTALTGAGILRPSASNSGTSGIFTAAQPGLATIQVKDAAGQTLSTLWVRVKYPIYVDIGSGGIHKDKTHEYLHAALNFDGALEFLDDDDEEEGTNKQIHLYVKNGESGNGCYVITKGETRELIGYSDVPDTKFILSGETANAGDLSDSQWEERRLPDGTTYYRITATYTPQQDSYGTYGLETNTIQFGSENFYVRVYKGTATATHADIEVEDGGSYRDSFTVYHADGSYTVISSKYSAEVVYVNQCDIFYNDTKMKNELTEEEYNRAARKIVSSEYGDNRTGGTQHEFTSAFKSKQKTVPDTSVGEYVDGDGNVRDKYGNIMYDVDEPWNPIPAYPKEGWTISRAIYRAYLDHVDFNVQLALTLLGEPSAQSFDAEGNPITLISGDEAYLELVQDEILLEKFSYTMDDAAIAAAYNKCPDRSGLDFKLVADVNQVLTEVNPQILKTVNGKEPGEGNVFEFGLYTDAACNEPVLDEKGQPVTAKTDENGIALFSADALVFSKADTYTFFIKEIIPGTPRVGMVYDTHVETVTIVVNKESNDQLTAKITYGSGGNTADFKNTTQYLLPDAGGTGTRPYIISGVMLMQTAILLFYLHRRRGARH